MGRTARVEPPVCRAGRARHYRASSDAEAFARQREVLLLRHDPTGVQLEIGVAWLPFEWDALQRATMVDFGGVKIPVATPEDPVVYKAVAWRDRDKSDIERLLVLHGRSMNLERVRAIVKQFSENARGTRTRSRVRQTRRAGAHVWPLIALAG